jgi:two-component system sensor histidine kinase TctE
MVLGNTALIEGIVNNLLDNACRHAFLGTPQASHSQITVSIDVLDAQVRLAVTDNGLGLPEARRAEVLQRWRKSSRESLLREGSGLGLAIVSEYARLLGAQLALDSGPGGIGLSVALEFDRG